MNIRGPMVTKYLDSYEVRPYQVGFPAELTSTWDATTGYSWKQLLLSGVTVAAESIPLTGDHAVTPDHATGLASGTRGWLEPDPQAGGWLFVPAGVGVLGLADPNADRILFWDDSAGALAWLTAGTGLTITGTTLTASGGSGVSGSGTDNHAVRWDGTGAVQDSYLVLGDGGEANFYDPTLTYSVLSADPGLLTASAPWKFGVGDAADAFGFAIQTFGVGDGFGASVGSAGAVVVTSQGTYSTVADRTVVLWGGVGQATYGGTLDINGVVKARLTVDAATGFKVSGTAGITATKTVKDGTGTNQTVTISGGIITGWT